MVEKIGELDLNKVYCMDCFEMLKKIPNNSVNLIIIDPPYNIKKDSWDDIENYESWLKLIILELQRILKDNGSFYMFHSEMEIVADFMKFFRDKTNFIFKQFIVWNKRFNGSPRKGFLDGFVEVNDLRNYQQMAEYILFYTVGEDKTGLQEIMDTPILWKELKCYFMEEFKKSNLTIKKANEIMGLVTTGSNIAGGLFLERKKSFYFPKRERYEMLQKTGFFKKDYSELKKVYEKIKSDCEDLRTKIEKNRYIFNNQKTHHSVWNYDIEKKQGHITPKPLDLIKNIILHSSNKNQLVLDCFIGSGTTAKASKELGRKFIGCDNKQEYVDLTNKRLQQEVLW